MSTGKFRQFANEINSKGPGAHTMPTFDNFKKDYKGPAAKATRKVSKEIPSSSMDGGLAEPLKMKTKEMSDAMATESQQWEKYQYDLN